MSVAVLTHAHIDVVLTQVKKLVEAQESGTGRLSTFLPSTFTKWARSISIAGNVNYTSIGVKFLASNYTEYRLQYKDSLTAQQLDALDLPSSYVFHRTPAPLRAAIKAAHCLEYNTSKVGRTAKMIEIVVRALEQQLSQVHPGYDKAPWFVPDRRNR